MMSFRRFEMADLPDAKKLVADAWYGKYYALMSKERSDRAFRAYIGHYLCRCTFAEVCEIDGKFAGYLIGFAKDEAPLFPDEEFPDEDSVPWLIRISTSKIYEADRDMLKGCSDCGFDSELQLYITDGKFRGKGVGSALMERFLAYLKETGHRKMFLYTDDFCSVDYYLKRGFKEENSVMLSIAFKKHKFMLLAKEL